MTFTSRRSNSTGGDQQGDQREYRGHLHEHAHRHRLTEPTPLAAPVNTEINDAWSGFTTTAERRIIYRDDKGTGDLYESTREGEGWSGPGP